MSGVNSTMNKKIILFLTFLLLLAPFAMAGEVSRNDVQVFFLQSPKNAVYSSGWHKHFLNKKVQWTGSIFSIQYQKDFNRTEVTLKILPGTMMYDTIVYVPGNISEKFEPGEEVAFSGSITRGVDMLGVKEVQVHVGRNLGDRFGNYVFSEQGMVNVHFLKPEQE